MRDPDLLAIHGLRESPFISFVVDQGFVVMPCPDGPDIEYSVQSIEPTMFGVDDGMVVLHLREVVAPTLRAMP